MKNIILVLLVFVFLSDNSWAEKIDLPPCRSFDFCYRVVLDSAGWEPSDKEPELVGRCEKIGDVCKLVGDDFWAICKVISTIMRPDIPLYYWTLYRKDKEERTY
jgi:hypothetical protein